jgi:APA family basic amino acid/polyamine antiporter
MVGVMGIVCGYVVGTLWPGFMSASNPGPMFMMAVAIAFSFLVAWIAHRGINGSTNVSIAINVIQITALAHLCRHGFSYRISHPAGSSIAWQFDSSSSEAYTISSRLTKTANGATDRFARFANGVPKPKMDASGKPVPYLVAYPDARRKRQLHQPPDSRLRWLEYTTSAGRLCRPRSPS